MPLSIAAHHPALENAREARRKAALARLQAAGDGLSPALVREGQASLRNAFALCDLVFGASPSARSAPEGEVPVAALAMRRAEGVKN